MIVVWLHGSTKAAGKGGNLDWEMTSEFTSFFFLNSCHLKHEQKAVALLLWLHKSSKFEGTVRIFSCSPGSNVLQWPLERTIINIWTKQGSENEIYHTEQSENSNRNSHLSSVEMHNDINMSSTLADKRLQNEILSWNEHFCWWQIDGRMPIYVWPMLPVLLLPSERVDSEKCCISATASGKSR